VSLLVVSGLSKRFSSAGVQAVDGVSFEVDEGRLFTLLGPSGCGKTTTLRCVAGLERPDAGEVRLAGRVLSGAGAWVPASERRVGMVFQSYAIWPHMDVFENAAFPLRVLPRRERPGRRELRRRVEGMLAAVKLDHLAGRPATDLSGGQQQRLALARALVMQPPLLLLDEPLSNLDARLREEMRFELKRLQSEVGFTAIYVTHDQIEALAMSDVVAVMRDGRIEQAGTPQEVYERPATTFVADFIGVSNLIEGVVEGPAENGTLLVRTPAGLVRAHAPAPLTAGQAVVLGVRAERVRMTGARDGAGWIGVVRDRAFLGETVDHVVSVAGLEVRVRSAAASAVPTGAEVALEFDEAAASLLPANGLRPGA
jgi:iron(III) transport system ATP-binding protein